MKSLLILLAALTILCAAHDARADEAEEALLKLAKNRRECQDSFIKPQINGVQLRLGPLTKVEVNRKNSRVNGGPEICRDTDAGRKPFQARYVIFHHDDYDSPNRKPDILCGVESTGWKHELCTEESNFMGEGSFPERLIVFGKGNYPILWYEGLSDQFYDSTYAHYQDLEIRYAGQGEYRPEKEGRPALTLFPLDKTRTELIWMPKDMKAPDGTPFAVSCVTTKKTFDRLSYDEMANCWVAYVVEKDLTVKYKFSSIVKKIPERARSIDPHVREMVAEWLRDGAAVAAENKAVSTPKKE